MDLTDTAYENQFRPSRRNQGGNTPTTGSYGVARALLDGDVRVTISMNGALEIRVHWR